MPRTISSASLAKIAAHRGVAPINILKIQWVIDGPFWYYADRTVPQWQNVVSIGKDVGVPGKILELGNIENVISLDKSQTSTSLSVKLDDSDGILKQIINFNDIHRRHVWLLQGFEDLPFGDSFEIYFGEISSPIEWDEGNRTLGFSVVSILEDQSSNKVGFQVDDIAFLNVNVKLIGKPWPLAFGTALKVPALNITPPPVLITRTGIGISDPNLSIKIAQLFQKYTDLILVANNNGGYARRAEEAAGAYYFEAEWQGQISTGSASSTTHDIGTDKLSDEDVKILQTVNDTGVQSFISTNNVRNSVADALLAKAKQFDSLAQNFASKANGYFAQASQVLIDMEALQLTYLAQSGYEKGIIYVNTDTFVPQLKNATIQINGAFFDGSFEADAFIINAAYHPLIIQSLTPNSPQIIIKNAAEIINNPQTFGSELYNQPISTMSLSTAPVSTPQQQSPGTTVTSQFQQFPDFRHQPVTKLGFFYAQPGSQIIILSPNPVTYAVNLITSQVGNVYAERTLLGTGLKYLSIVPTSYYSVGTLSIGIYEVTTITFETPLSCRLLEGWDDNIWVDVISEIGPNTIDEMEWLIETYSSLDIDESSFDTVKSILSERPSNFALLTRDNVLKILNDIAFQAKCILWIIDNIIYIRHLGILPNYIDTITEDDIDVSSMKIKCDDTENMFTRLIGTWRTDYYHKNLYEVGVENNVSRYGIREKTIDYYIYNDPNLIYENLAYWLIRYSNPWKHLIIKTSLNKLNLDALDPVNLSFRHKYIANLDQQVTGIIEKCTYDSNTYSIDLDIWCPVRLGEMTVYPFAYPDTYAEFQLYPVNEDTRQNLIPDGVLPPIVLIKPSVNSFYFTNPSQYNGQFFTTNIQEDYYRLTYNYAPDDGPATPTDISGLNDYQFNTYPDIQQEDRNLNDSIANQLITRTPSVPYPGSVISFLGPDPDDNTKQYYMCNVYVDGQDNPPEVHFVKQLQIDSSAILLPGAYVQIFKNVYSESDVTGDLTLESYLNITIVYTMQAPVWQSSGMAP